MFWHTAYAAYFDFSRQNTTIQGQSFLILLWFLYTPVFVLSVYLLEDAVYTTIYQQYDQKQRQHKTTSVYMLSALFPISNHSHIGDLQFATHAFSEKVLQQAVQISIERVPKKRISCLEF